MIEGVVRNHFAWVTLALVGPNGHIEVEFLLDTGFEGEISLPGRILRTLDSPVEYTQLHEMADGALQECEVHLARPQWEGVLRDVEALSLEHDPLVGVLLLAGCHLDMEMRDGGQVVIERP